MTNQKLNIETARELVEKELSRNNIYFHSGGKFVYTLANIILGVQTVTEARMEAKLPPRAPRCETTPGNLHGRVRNHDFDTLQMFQVSRPSLTVLALMHFIQSEMCAPWQLNRPIRKRRPDSPFTRPIYPRSREPFAFPAGRHYLHKAPDEIGGFACGAPMLDASTPCPLNFYVQHLDSLGNQVGKLRLICAMCEADAETMCEAATLVPKTLGHTFKAIPIRWNVEEREDGTYICKGEHENAAPCQWEKLSPMSGQPDANQGGRQPRTILLERLTEFHVEHTDANGKRIGPLYIVHAKRADVAEQGIEALLMEGRNMCKGESVNAWDPERYRDLDSSCGD